MSLPFKNLGITKCHILYYRILENRWGRWEDEEKQMTDTSDMIGTHTERLGSGELCSLWWRAPTTKPSNPMCLFYIQDQVGGGWLILGRGLCRGAVSEKEAGVGWCSLHTLSTFTWLRGRLGRFPVPDLWKVLLFSWAWGTGVLDRALLISTIHVHLGYCLLPTMKKRQVCWEAENTCTKEYKVNNGGYNWGAD